MKVKKTSNHDLTRVKKVVNVRDKNVTKVDKGASCIDTWFSCKLNHVNK